MSHFYFACIWIELAPQAYKSIHKTAKPTRHIDTRINSKYLQLNTDFLSRQLQSRSLLMKANYSAVVSLEYFTPQVFENATILS